MDLRQRDQDKLNQEFEAAVQQNKRLEFTCEEYKAKILEKDNMMQNYRTMQEENRKLYNQIQDLRGNIRVFLRWVPVCRPLS
jgi:hypothetical protein